MEARLLIKSLTIASFVVMKKEYAERLLRKTKEDYNLIADDFSRTREYVPEDRKSLLLQNISPKDRVLDSGCGNGRLYVFSKDKQADYYGIDISEKLIEIAKSRYPEAKFQVADVLNLPFPENFFDKILSFATLHHIPSGELRMQAFKEAKRVLKKDGFLLVTVWNLWQRRTAWQLFFKNAFLKLVGKTGLDFKDIFYPWRNSDGKILAQRYFHLFTKKELKKIAEKAGFLVKEVGILERPGSKDNNIYLIAQKPS